MIHFIKCTDGKERQIFPAKIKHKDLIRYHTLRFNSSAPIVNIMAVNNENVSNFLGDNDKMFDETPYNSMMEILRLAFGEIHSVEEIEGFIDVEMIHEILDIFYGLSGFKKKATNQTAPIGTNS